MCREKRRRVGAWGANRVQGGTEAGELGAGRGRRRWAGASQGERGSRQPGPRDGTGKAGQAELLAPSGAIERVKGPKEDEQEREYQKGGEKNKRRKGELEEK
ncbi:hypothetical protein E2562_005857 [Oryza meyeriana var. granulata]|uniref:Uncharacterized protein n=1 Tax=Oryza meyeriana var. granulata TaxID=110450 RepID=A0A6G1CET3_9ORYZ|nr:hypothetical protein E2562_005857 [Oryza meyeriana var. granulata]